jgi:hypothetical protein
VDALAVKLEIKLKNGQSHRLELGSKDPIGIFAYAKIDGAQNVTMISDSVLSSSAFPNTTIVVFPDETEVVAQKHSIS